MTGRRIAAVRTAAGGLTAAALLASSACSHSGKSNSAGGDSKKGGAAATSSSPAATPQSVAQAFLTAWSSGDYAGAAALTDDAKDASARLKDIATSLSPQKTTLTLGQQENVAAGASSPSSSGSAPASSASGSAPAAAATVARFGFTVDDTFANNLTWHYDSGLNLVQGPNGAPVVHWNSSVIHPLLGPTALLKAVPPPQTVTDATGTQIDTAKHPTLTAAVNAIGSHVPANSTPTQLTVEFVDPKTGSPLQGQKTWSLSAPGAAPASTSVKTTIDPKVQSAIETALTRYPNSGMVAIQPSTGDILGMASNDAGFPSLAYKAQRAPGSTFKVITTALALQQGLQTTTPVNCNSGVTVEGKVITNDDSLSGGIPGALLKNAFEASCNTAFVNLALDGKLGSDYGALAAEAKTYFGMNQKWDLGMGPATYGTSGDSQVPVADGKGAFAREAFGQDKIEMSPLTMASVAATVCNNGQFKQPILVPGTPQVSATPLPAGVASQLNTLMQGVFYNSDGTAHDGHLNLVPGLAGKTGSAESGDTPTTKKTDSWMIVYDKQKDIAFGALVLNGGFGVQAAGPAIEAALAQLGVR